MYELGNRNSEMPFMEGHTADRYGALKLGFISSTVVLMVDFSISATACNGNINKRNKKPPSIVGFELLLLCL